MDELKTMSTLAVLSALVILGRCAVIIQVQKIAPWDEDEDDRTSSLSYHRAHREEGDDVAAVPTRDNGRPRELEDSFGFKLVLFLSVAFVVILILLCKLFFCKKCREMYGPLPPPYVTFANEDSGGGGANDKPPPYAEVLMGDYAAETGKFPGVASNVPETPPPQYEEGNVMKF